MYQGVKDFKKISKTGDLFLEPRLGKKTCKTQNESKVKLDLIVLFCKYKNKSIKKPNKNTLSKRGTN